MTKRAILLLIILVFVFLLRFYNLANVPSGFHADEAAFGWNAYSILQTGRDEYGKFLPLTFRSFDDYKAGLNVYLIVPFIKVFGLNEFAVRFPSVIIGMLLVGLTYFLTKKIAKNEKLAFLTSLLIAICPTSILLGRVQSDPLLSIFFIFLSLYFFLLWKEKKGMINLFCFLLSIVLSFYSNTLPRAFYPIYIFLLGFFYWKEISVKQKKLLFVGVVLVFILDLYLIFGVSGSRFGQVSVMSSPSVTSFLREHVVGKSRNIFEKVIYNKVTAVGYSVISNYVSYLNLNFLYFKGGQPLREIVPNSGILYLLELPFLVLGIYQVVKKKYKWGGLLILWILIVPFIFSLASDETPNDHRFFLAVLPIEILTGIGLLRFGKFFITNKFEKIVFGLFLIMVYYFSLYFYLRNLFIYQPIISPYYRGYAYRELNQKLDLYSPHYNKIVITKGNVAPYIYMLFFQKFSPKKYQESGSNRDFEGTGFGKFIFTEEKCPFSFDLKNKILYVDDGDCEVPKDAWVLSIVRWLDGKIAFKLLQVK
jgi:4-amino-4-deoxy-L-arabinose transferase-like glycosyltransferase